MRSMKTWARTLLTQAEADMPPPGPVLAAFARHYLQLAEHADRQTEAAAAMLEARAAVMRLETRLDMSAEAIALQAAASDLRAGLHLGDTPPTRSIHAHVDGGLYEVLPIAVETKNDLTGDWDEGVAYRSLSMRRDVLYVTSQQRFDDRFIEVEDPDA